MTSMKLKTKVTEEQHFSRYCQATMSMQLKDKKIAKNTSKNTTKTQFYFRDNVELRIVVSLCDIVKHELRGKDTSYWNISDRTDGY